MIYKFQSFNSVILFSIKCLLCQEHKKRIIGIAESISLNFPEILFENKEIVNAVNRHIDPKIIE